MSIYRSLDEVRGVPDAVVIFEGDYGGTIYASIPVKYLPKELSQQDLCDLGLALEKSCWGCNISDDEPTGGYSVYFKTLPAGSGILGGMGGGAVIDGLWAHPGLDAADIQLIRRSLHV